MNYRQTLLSRKSVSKQRENILPSYLKDIFPCSEELKPKYSHLQDKVAVVRLTVQARPSAASVMASMQLSLLRIALKKRGLLTAFSGSKAVQNFQMSFRYLPQKWYLLMQI